MPFNNNDSVLMRASHRQWLPPNTGHKFANCNAELQLKSLYKLFKVSLARHAGYIELTSFIVFAKMFCIVKWIENVVVYQRGLEVFKDVKLYITKAKQLPSTFTVKIIKEVCADPLTE